MIEVARYDGNVLYRGPRPKSYEEFSLLPVKTVINLQSGWFEFLHHKAYNLLRWGEHCFPPKAVHYLPLSDFHAPTPTEVEAFLTLVGSAMRDGGVYFCCLHGVDRTGFMAAKYRQRIQGWPRGKALEEMLRLGFHVFPYWSWLKKV